MSYKVSGYFVRTETFGANTIDWLLIMRDDMVLSDYINVPSCHECELYGSYFDTDPRSWLLRTRAWIWSYTLMVLTPTGSFLKSQSWWSSAINNVFVPLIEDEEHIYEPNNSYVTILLFFTLSIVLFVALMLSESMQCDKNEELSWFSCIQWPT